MVVVRKTWFKRLLSVVQKQNNDRGTSQAKKTIIESVKQNLAYNKTYMCCVFRPANGCSTHHLLVEIIFFASKQVFSYFSVTNGKKRRKIQKITKKHA